MRADRRLLRKSNTGGEAMAPEERARLRAEGTAHLRAAGADLVIDGIADLPRAIDEIEREIAARAARSRAA